MRINGKEIQGTIREEVRESIARDQRPLHLAVVSVGDDPVIRNFVTIKKRFAEDVGVIFSEKLFSRDVSASALQETIQELSNNPNITGVIVQLPLPAHLNTASILEYISPSKDVDVLSSSAYALFTQGKSVILPPVVGAIAEICKQHDVTIKGRRVVILGNGRLVGAPAAVWFHTQGGQVVIFDKLNPPPPDELRNADIIVCGMGHAQYIKPEMVKEKVILFDAGTSESAGVIVGDVDPHCEAIAHIFTPVPGGIGPITVAMIFRNLLALRTKSQPNAEPWKG